MPTALRTNRFNLMVNDDEHRMLSELAEHQAVSAATVIRSALRSLHRETFPEQYRRPAKSTRGKR